MTDTVENLVLEHLRAIRADIARMERKQDDTITRLGRLELAVSPLSVAAPGQMRSGAGRNADLGAVPV